MTLIKFTIYGECASKSNSRELATIGPKSARKTILRKSQKALDYVASALRQIPPTARVRMQGAICVRLVLFYASMRPDMDEQLLLDCLQDQWTRRDGERVLVQKGVILNDRQIVERHVYRRQDPKRPRAEIEITSAAETPDFFDGDDTPALPF